MFDIEVSLRSLICEDKNLRRNAELERENSFRTGTSYVFYCNAKTVAPTVPARVFTQQHGKPANKTGYRTLRPSDQEKKKSALTGTNERTKNICSQICYNERIVTTANHYSC